MKKLLLLLIGLTFSTIYAQKSSPVMGDAATLIDLLKKDYNTVNPETRDEEINTDRGKVIGIFKSYLTENQKEYYSSLVYKDSIKKLDSLYKLFLKSKENQNSISKINITVSNSDNNLLSNVKGTVDSMNKTYISSKEDYFNFKHKIDSEEFKALSYAYGLKIIMINDENRYLHDVLNSFIKKYDNLQKNNLDSFAEKNAYSSIQKSLPFLGGDLAFETLIDGLSRFLAKRIKEELTIHAIDKIKNYLENPTPENYCYELLVLLPTTTNYLKTFEADRLLNFTDEIKQYIEQDLNDLLSNAVNLKNTPRLKSYIAKNPDLEFAFEGLEIIPQLSKIKSPIDYFEILENSRTLNLWREDNSNHTKYNIAQSLRLASMLAYSMTVIDNGETKFASVDFLSNYGNEINFYFLYFGFLHQQNIKYFNVKFLNATLASIDFDLHSMMNSIPPSSVNNTTNNFKFLKTSLIAIAQNAEKIYSQILLLKKKKKNNEEIKYNEVHTFVDDIIYFSEELVKTADFLTDLQYKIVSTDLTEISLKEKIQPYFNTAKVANNIMLDLHEKKYANAIIKTIEIPLTFKSEVTTENLLNISTSLSANNNLTLFNSIFKEGSFSNLSVDEKIAKLKLISISLEVFVIKIADNQELNNLEIALNTFIAYVNGFDGGGSTIDTLDEKIEALKIVVRPLVQNDTLMMFLNISKSKILTSIKESLEKKGYDIGIRTSINAKVDTYITNQYKKYIINDPINSTEEQTLKEILKEFAPQLLQSNSKIADNKAIKLIHLINDLSQSKDAEEVEKAIEAFALPVGSSSLKEKASTFVSINAFPGIIFGNERSNLESNKDSFAVGFTAPVGFYLQFCNNNKSGVWGTFIPIIDIAAPVRLRLDDNATTQNLPDFTFKDIFSPGIYLTYGFHKSPFALNFGIQSGPKLRNISEDGGATFKDVDSYRVSAGVVVDIPLFTLSSKYKD